MMRGDKGKRRGSQDGRGRGEIFIGREGCQRNG